MSGDPYASWTDDELAGLEHGFRSDLYDGRVALVTGGAGGIGRAICMLLGKLGAQIITCGRDETKLLELEQSLGSHGIDVCSIPMTIRDPEGVAQLIAAAWDECGGLDLVVNNAGGQFAAPAMEISPKGWAAVVETNLYGPWFVMQESARIDRQYRHYHRPSSGGYSAHGSGESWGSGIGCVTQCRMGSAQYSSEYDRGWSSSQSRTHQLSGGGAPIF